MEIPLRKYLIHASLAVTEIPCSVRPHPHPGRPYNAVEIWKIKELQVSFVHTFVFVFEKTRARKLHDYRGVIVFEKFSFHANENPAFLNTSCLKSVLETFRFHHGLI